MILNFLKSWSFPGKKDPKRYEFITFPAMFCTFTKLARQRRPPAAFLLNGAITRGANGTKTFPWTYPNYMQSFIKIRGAVLEKNADKIMTLCNFNKDYVSPMAIRLSVYVKACVKHILQLIPISVYEIVVI